VDRSNSCKHCKYFDREGNNVLGECKRHAPVYVNRVYFSGQYVEAREEDSIFPAVCVDWWCGDFEL